METKRCLYCGNTMPAKRETKKYCNPRCRYLAFIGNLKNGTGILSKNAKVYNNTNANANGSFHGFPPKERHEMPEEAKLKQYVREALEDFLLKNPLTLSFGTITVIYSPNTMGATNAKRSRQSNQTNGNYPLQGNALQESKEEEENANGSFLFSKNRYADEDSERESGLTGNASGTNDIEEKANKNALFPVSLSDEDNPEYAKQENRTELTLDDELEYGRDKEYDKTEDSRISFPVSGNEKTEQTTNDWQERENGNYKEENTPQHGFGEFYAEEDSNEVPENAIEPENYEQTEKQVNANAIISFAQTQPPENRNENANLVIASENNPASNFMQPREQDPLWVESRFNNIFTDVYNDMYAYTENWWHRGSDINTVRSVSARFLTLLKGTFKLTCYRLVDMAAVEVLADAYTKLVESASFKWLPHNYPYRKYVVSLNLSLSKIVKNYSNRERIRISFTPKRKAEIMCLIIAMNGKLPSIKFNELTFD